MKKYFSILIILCTVGIHAQELLPYPLDTINGEEFYRYEIERSIGLYRISVNFGVPQSEIIRYNPQIQEYGIRYGETLSIPTKRPVVRQTEAVVVSTTVTETAYNPTETLKLVSGSATGSFVQDLVNGMPDLIGMNVDEARRAYDNLDIVVISREHDGILRCRGRLVCELLVHILL